MFETPILYLIFNRPDLTEISFSEICKIKPRKLFIAADGPRCDNENDEVNCTKARKHVLSMISWDCELQTLFRDENIGCGLAVSSAISWFFNHVDEGIILEDDCLPNSSFFTYCENLLDYYRVNNNIYHINGSNHQFGIKRSNKDYYFSIYPHVWGWATWKRAWNHYDYSMTNLEYFINKVNFKKYGQLNLMNDVKNGNIDTWDVQWAFSIMKRNGIVITPNINLITNIGFNENATHTNFKVPDYVRFSKNGIINFSLNHPIRLKVNKIADNFTYKFVHKVIKPNNFDYILRKIYRFYYIHIIYKIFNK